MSFDEQARRLRNAKAKEWRDKNKDKVKAIQERYWIKRAKQLLEREENNHE